MKKFIYLLAFALLANTTAKSHPGDPVKIFEPRASFDKIWVDYDITEGGDRGMRIHIKFTAYDMLGMDAYLAIYFEYNDEGGGNLKDKNEKFNSTAGDVAVYKSIKPKYDPAVYEDLQVFMPYSELDLDPGTYDLSMDVKIIKKEGGTISKLTNYDFEYTKPGTSKSGNPAGATAEFHKLWVDYDVTVGGKKGLRVHVKFTLRNLKGVDCYLAIYFEKKNGDKLTSDNSTYRSKSGQLAGYVLITPGYKDAIYEDETVFVPYSEFKLPKGKTDLKLDADIIYKNGDMLKHLEYHEFWIDK